MSDMGPMWYEVWERWGRIVNSGERSIRVYEVKSHTGDAALTAIVHQKGNGLADFHAGQAVIEVPELEIK